MNALHVFNEKNSMVVHTLINVTIELNEYNDACIALFFKTDNKKCSKCINNISIHGNQCLDTRMALFFVFETTKTYESQH